jgi:hypothetical protein
MLSSALLDAAANEWASFAATSPLVRELNPPRKLTPNRETRPKHKVERSKLKLVDKPVDASVATVLSDLEKARNDAFRAWVDTGADMVFKELRSETPIDRAIDAVFDDVEWLACLQRYEEALKKAPIKKALHTTRDYFPWVYTHNLASPRTKQLAERVAKLIAATVTADRNLVERHWRAPTSKQPDPTDHLWFMSDYAIPPALQDALLYHRRSAIAVVSTYPITTPVPTVEAFPYIMQLLSYARDSLELYLGVLANVPEADIKIVPADGSDVARVETDLFEPFRKALISGDGVVAAPD